MDQADAWYSYVRVCLQWSFTGVYENEYGHIYRVPIGRETGMEFQASLALNRFYDKQAC